MTHGENLLVDPLLLQQTPGIGGSQNAESSEQQPGANLNNEQTSEGFICPQCMKSHNSAEELFKHYDLFHDTGDLPSNMAPTREDLTMLRQEVQDLHVSLKEERWFSGELKKELDKVQGHLKQGDGPDTSEDSALEQKLSEAETEKFHIKQMRDLFEQKAAQLATEIVDIKSRYDEEKSLREAADQRLASLGQDLERQRQDNDILSTELLQRPGVEDVTVLQKELVQVQTLMDSMAREREEESERYKHQYQELVENHATAGITISQLKAELEKGPQEAAVYTQQIHQLQSTVNSLQQQSQSLSDKLSRREKEQQQLGETLAAEQASGRALHSSLQARLLELQEAQLRAAAGEASLQRARAELGETGQEVARLKQEALELQVKHGELKAERKQMLQQREEKESQGAQQQTEIGQLHANLLEAERQLGELQGRLKEQRQLSGEKLKDREQQAADLQLQLSRAEEQLKEAGVKTTDLQHLLDKASKQQQELQTQQQNTTSKLREAQSDLEQVLRQLGDKDQKIQNVEALLQKGRDGVSQLEAERDELCAKIQAGQGETALLGQMKEKNLALQEQVSQLTDKLKNQSESHKQARDNLHEQVQEQKSLLRAAQDAAHTLETFGGELSAQLAESKEKGAQLNTQLKAKTEMLLSSEASKAGQRADLENHLETAQNALQDKQQVSSWVCAVSTLFSTQLIASLAPLVSLILLPDKANRNQPRFLKSGITSLSWRWRWSLTETGQTNKCCPLQTSEKERSLLQLSLDTLTQDGQAQRADLERKAKGLAADLQKAQQQRDAHGKDLVSTKESLGKVNKAMKETQGQLDSERRGSKAALEEKEKSHEKTRVELQKKVEVITKESQETKGQVDRMREAEKGLKAQLAALTEQSSKSLGVLQEKERGLQQLQAQLQKTQASLEQEKQKLESQVSELQETITKKAEELVRLQDQASGLGQELGAERTRSTGLQEALEQSQQARSTLQEHVYGKESEVSALRQDLKVSEEKLCLAQEEQAANRSHQAGLEGKVQDLSQSHASLEQELGRRDQALQQQAQALKELQRRHEELGKERSRAEELMKAKSAMESTSARLTSELKVFTEKSEKELSGLQEAKALLIQQKLEVQGQLEAERAVLQTEQQAHQATRDSVAQLDQKLLSQRRGRAEQAKQAEEAQGRLGVQLAALGENVATLKREWQGSQRRSAELEKQTDELRGEIAVLEATVQNNQDERRALLERCVKGEGEMEKLQAKALEMRRRLDDTTAAMQELGRENQSLQIKQSQSLTRKWAEDHEVTHCLGCGKGFSVTIRRHHCRHCGNIYCAECSCRNALTPSSKKPVRVCESCFDELQG
uniref:Early endosome antigen 1 n=1 Tax=Gadus morhua TaxID=8049 RepID=A0A8C5FPE9_GADMO